MHQKSANNLKRRLAGLTPLDPPADGPTAPFSRISEQDGPTYGDFTVSESDQEESPADESLDESSDEATPEFVAEMCLFCQHSSETFDESMVHMHQTHGLFIPDRDRLLVDLETLVRYFHLVIFGYKECLFCHSRRSSTEGARQHMIGKGHCKFDISSEDSEYLDFYQSGSGRIQGDDSKEASDDLDEELGFKSRRSALPLSRVDESSARLPSGKLLSHRSNNLAQRSRPRPRDASTEPHLDSPAILQSPDQQNQPTDPSPSTGETISTALTKSEKRENKLSMQLANLSIRDRATLAHLPASEQRCRDSTAAEGKVEGTPRREALSKSLGDDYK